MSIMDTQILDKPIFSMTGREFLELFNTKIEHLAQEKTITHDFTQKKYVYGLKGIATLFGCGTTKAQQIKNSGQIDGAIYQTGKKIVVDSELALRLMQNKS